MSEILYMRISTHNMACLQHQMHTYITQLYIMSIQPAKREREGERDVLCVCACARARARVCVCVCKQISSTPTQLPPDCI